MTTLVCLKMATKPNGIDRIVALWREVPGVADANGERHSVYDAFLAGCNTNGNLLTLCYIVNFSQNSFPSIYHH